MKTAVSMPDAIFKAAEKLAKRLGISRSALYTHAIVEFLQKHKNDGVTTGLNEIYAQETSSVEPGIQTLQSASLTEEEW
jgi:predicted transcriptional regulator